MTGTGPKREKTKEEVASGVATAPRRPRADEPHRPLSRRFGREQMSSDGRMKVRAIDDFTASGINATVSVPEKLRHDPRGDDPPAAPMVP